MCDQTVCTVYRYVHAVMCAYMPAASMQRMACLECRQSLQGGSNAVAATTAAAVLLHEGQVLPITAAGEWAQHNWVACTGALRYHHVE
jgi:hypothetical protein